MKIQFTQAENPDVHIILLMMQEFNSIDNYPFDKNKTEKNLFELINNKNLGRIWLIKSNNIIIGYVVLAFGFSFEYGGRDAFIDELFIKADFRNKGIGQKTMSFLEEKARELNINTLHLEVETHNNNASKLYVKNGFKNNDRKLLSKKISSF